MTAWVLNLKNRALTQYEGYVFNSLATLNSITLGASVEGIFVLDGLTDNGAPIECSFETLTSDYGAQELKNISDLYVTLMSQPAKGGVEPASGADASPIRVSVVTDDGFTRTYDVMSPVYQGSTRSASGVNCAYTARISLSRGIAGRYWSVIVENQEGAFISVVSITPVVHPLRCWH
ncbi:MAG: hypothetical protein HQL06_13725 [Nitrospirae bacterium]|nr:hypothetical protein [Nitrospirota bacterium]